MGSENVCVVLSYVCVVFRSRGIESGREIIGPRDAAGFGCGSSLSSCVDLLGCKRVRYPALVTSWDYIHALSRGVHTALL